MKDSLLDDSSVVTGKVDLNPYPDGQRELRDDAAEPLDRVAGGQEQRTESCPREERQRLDLTWRQLNSDLARSQPTQAVANWPIIPGYVIVGELGRGGMGVVYLAQQKGLQRLVALKMISTCSAAKASDALDRFRAEAEAAARLQHPNIVQIYDIGELHGLPFFSLEFMEGGSLDASLDRKPQPPTTSAKLVESLSRAAHHAHQHGIIHRDLKPSNVLLTGDGVPKISDFGLAKQLDQSGSTKTGEILGTPSYMAPEQAAGGSQPVGPAADVYALGAMLYEVLTGRPPFLGATSVETVLQARCQDPVPPSRLQPGIPRDLETICLKCLEKSPAKRFATALDLADDLYRFQAGEPIRARPTALWERAWKWTRRRPTSAALIAFSLAALLALTALGLHHFATLEHERQLAGHGWVAAQAEAQRAIQQKQEAQEQKKAADANYRLAREAVDALVKLVREHPRLKKADMAELRESLTQTALKYYQALVEQNPRDPALRTDQGRACWQLADLVADYSSKADSIRLYEQSRDIFARLAKEEPDVAVHRFNLAQTHVNLGYMQTECGLLAAAEPHFQKAQELLADLLRHEAARPDYLLVLAKNQGNWGYLLTLAGQHETAGRHYASALEVDRRLIAQEPLNSAYRTRLGHDLTSMGTQYRQLQKYAEAEAAHREARQVFERLACEHPREVHYHLAIARSHGYLGFLGRDRGLLAAAEVELFRALEIQEALARAEPLATSHRSDIGITCNDLGNIYRERREDDRAAAMYQRAAGMQAGLVAQDPANLHFQVALAGSQCNHAHVLRDCGRRDEALPVYDQAVANLEGVLKREPQHGRARLYLRNAVWGRAAVLTAQKRFEPALDDWDRAVELDSGRNQAHFRLRRAFCAVKLGRYPEATSSVLGQSKALGKVGHLHYDAAVVLALASRAVARDNDTPSAERESLSEAYAAKAVELLARAREQSYFDSPTRARYLRNDPDLDSLRSREDFKRLLTPVPNPE